MNLPFSHLNCFVTVTLQEAVDYRNLHIEYRAPQGIVVARFAKVYKKTGLFHLFNADSNTHGELKDAAGNLLLTITSYWGATKREAKVEIHNPDGTLFGTLYDANWGADFELPDGTVIGKARRPSRPDNEAATEPTEVVHTFFDASEQKVGLCNRHYERPSPEQRDGVWEALTLSVDTGPLVQTVALANSVDPTLHTFLFLFPALQRLRHIRSG